MNRISVIIITKNEADKIERCLDSVKWADEIIIVDSGSNDGTIDLAKRYTSKIFFNEWQGFSKQKELSLNKASNEWVLSIDADEQVTEQLKNKLLTLNESPYSGYLIKRENYFLGKLITTCGWDKDYQLRFFKKSRTSLSNRLVHEGFIVDGSTARLEEKILHNSYSSIKDAISKINMYSSLEAEVKAKTSKRVRKTEIILHTFSAFFRYFISLKGYKDGMHGFMISFLNGLTSLLNYTKLWELQNRKKA